MNPLASFPTLNCIPLLYTVQMCIYHRLYLHYFGLRHSLSLLVYTHNMHYTISFTKFSNKYMLVQLGQQDSFFNLKDNKENYLIRKQKRKQRREANLCFMLLQITKEMISLISHADLNQVTVKNVKNGCESEVFVKFLLLLLFKNYMQVPLDYSSQFLKNNRYVLRRKQLVLQVKPV